MISKVTKIINPEGRTGFSQKTNKQWTMAEVELETGDKTFIFAPINVGDEVESYENEYRDKEGNTKTATNWKRTSSRPASQMEQVVVNMLKEVVETQKKHSETLDAIHKAITGDEFTPDEFKTESMDEPIDLNEIPF